MSTTTSTTKRSAARTKGLRIAAKVATVGGLAIAALGLAEAHAAASASAQSPSTTRAPTALAGHDDTQALPMEGIVSGTRGGNCGCAPCWGPPAPPEKRSARARSAKRAARKRAPKGRAPKARAKAGAR